MALSVSQTGELPGFTGFFVFGDSLVDPGNALAAAKLLADFPFVSLPNGAPTASKGYFEGRFSDGYNFADLISNKLLAEPTQPTFPYGFEDPIFGLTIPFVSRPDGNALSFAYGGAQVRRGDELVPDLDDQREAGKRDRERGPDTSAHGFVENEARPERDEDRGDVLD